MRMIPTHRPMYILVDGSNSKSLCQHESHSRKRISTRLAPSLAAEESKHINEPLKPDLFYLSPVFYRLE
jgi:hypothetical protein